MVGGFKFKSNIDAKIGKIVCEKANRDDYALDVAPTNVIQAFLMNDSLNRMKEIVEWEECGTKYEERLTKECEMKYTNNILNILEKH